MVPDRDLLIDMAVFGGMLLPAFVFWYLSIRAARREDQRKARNYKIMAICIAVFCLGYYFVGW